MKLDKSNYFSPKASQEYMSVSQFKAFMDCEAAALAEVNGEYERHTTKALMVGSYVDAWFSGEYDDFVKGHPEIFKRDGTLKADYFQADQCIARCESDPLFIQYMCGNVQQIMTGELFGVKWKVKVDSLHDDKIVDLKVMRSMDKVFKDGEWKTFVDAWGYDIQGYVYQQIVAQNTGKELPFYLAVVTKEDVPNIDIIHIPQWRLNGAAALIEHYVKRFDAIKKGEVEPKRCGKCDYCKSTKVLTEVTEYDDLLD